MRALALIALLACGCSAGFREQTHLAQASERKYAEPKVGSLTILPDPADLWDNPEPMRMQHKLLDANEWDRDDPAIKAIDRHRVGLLWQGDLVKIIEIGPDYVALLTVRNTFGDPTKLKHGYIERWWDTP